MTVDLAGFRTTAAIASGGRASDPIYATIERVLVERRAGGRLLDLGAGKGNLTRRLYATGMFSQITAADIVPRPAGLPDVIDWLSGDLNGPLAAAPATFDTIVCSEVIKHLENPRALLREIARLLTSGGLAGMLATTEGPGQEAHDCGLTLPIGSPETWAPALEALIGDPKLQAELGQNEQMAQQEHYAGQHALSDWADLLVGGGRAPVAA